MALREIALMASQYVETPWVLLLAIPAILLVILLLSRDWVELREDTESSRRKTATRRFMYVSRSIIAVLFVIALSTPYLEHETTIEGAPFVKILVDNSTSMRLYDQNISGVLRDKLGQRTSVEIATISQGEASTIADGILDNLRERENILLITDGQNTKGANLGDAALYAQRINASLSFIELTPLAADARISISGPSKTLSEVENTWDIAIGRVGNAGDVEVVVTLDGEALFNEVTDKDHITITRTLGNGNHVMTATIKSNDAFPENNQFAKTISVVPKPKVLYLSAADGPLHKLLKDGYDVTRTDTLPTDLAPYYAALLVDMPAGKFSGDEISRLADYTADGNGLIVVGGKNSFEHGSYKDSRFETLLPVFVASPGKKPGDINVVLVIDISGSTGTGWGGANVVDVEKALALDVYQNSLKFDNRLALVTFNTLAYVVSPMSYVFEKSGLDATIRKIQWGGGTLIEMGVLKAADLLAKVPGSKNIILISDGQTQIPANALLAAQKAADDGVRIYTVGVGPQTNEQLMRAMADITGGIYFRAQESSRLKILFGDVEEERKRTAFPIIPLNHNHFITQDIELPGVIYGYNSVVPKSTARLLITTSGGDPVLSLWRYGLGRVEALTTDDGGVWAGELLNKQNSKLISRMVNWAIGEPDRKASGAVSVKDARLGEPATVTIRTDKQPQAQGVTFYKVDEGVWEAVLPTTTVGVQRVMDVPFAVNYAREYEGVGVSGDVEAIAQATGGKLFKAEDVDGIAEFAKSKATRTLLKRDPVRAPFLIAIIAVFLLEVLVRRIHRR
ncbi:VWA domain-containing protein [Candidatus Woesearchaeota archaeon]|nr:VWA domain-containing protein [Candidatus Woesearchaeota archaeon]